MTFFELEPADIANLDDADLRELVGRLCEAELIRQNLSISPVNWGGAQEAPDGGLDVNVIDAVNVDTSSFIPRENTGFQVKRNKMPPAQCINEMLHEAELKPVIEELADKQGAYIIVSGKDNCSDGMRKSRLQGMHTTLDKLNNKDDLKLDFYCGHRLSTWLKKFPAVALWARAKLNKPLAGWRSFGRWAATPLKQDDQFLQDEHPCISDVSSNVRDPISVADGIKLIRNKLRQKGTSVRITGLSGVGKTRFAQALFEKSVGQNALPKDNVVYADLGDDLTPSATDVISYFIHQSLNCYLVLDNCPPEQHRRFQKQLSDSPSKIHLLTIEYDISDDTPEGTDVIHMEPSSEKTVSTLVQKRYPKVSEQDANRIAEFAGGNARVAITLASRVLADESLANFTDDALFKRLFFQRKGESERLLESAEILSLVYSFNVATDKFNNELDVLAQMGEVKRKVLHRDHAELLSRQIAQKRGDWRAVLPHAIANRLAKRALKSIPLEQINVHLFKPENLRLLKSCAHRLGYLHDSEEAKVLLASWFGSVGPFQNLAHCNESQLKALDYFAPVSPEAVLGAIEKAASIPGFCTRTNKHFSMIVRLLRKIAYEDKFFDRAALLLLRFAETEKANENVDSIVENFSGLFSLYLSGTLAEPKHRHMFVRRMILSKETVHYEIIRKVFRCALQSNHWTSFHSFDFGARNRGYGWQPTTQDDVRAWYIGFIEILRPLLNIGKGVSSDFARDVLAESFRGLWNRSGCEEVLESLAKDFAAVGRWPALWLAIKRTIHYDSKNMSEDRLIRLLELEKLTAPSDLYSEIESYVLVDTWEQAEIRGGNFRDEAKKISRKVASLGELASSSFHILETLAPKLWSKHINTLWDFGRGLAQGAIDQKMQFQKLVQLMQKQNLTAVQPGLFIGFIAQVHETAPELAKELQESVLDIPELKPLFVYILSATPIASWGVEKLLQLAENAELDAHRFSYLSSGGALDKISDDDLASLLLAINYLEGGASTSLELLVMRFHYINTSGYYPDENLRAVGRVTLARLLLSQFNSNQRDHQSFQKDVLNICFCDPVPANEIQIIVDVLCSGFESYKLSSSTQQELINCLMTFHPGILLDRVFLKEEGNGHLIYCLFSESFGFRRSPLDRAPFEKLITWCNGNQYKIQKLVSFATPYISTDKDAASYDNPKSAVLTEHIKSFLNEAEDKIAIVETIFTNTCPSCWSGSLAQILDVRSKAFAELTEHTDTAVREYAATKLQELKVIVAKEYENEANENRFGEQTFE